MQVTVEWETEVSLLTGCGGAGGIVAICLDYWVDGMPEGVKRDWFHLLWDISTLHCPGQRSWGESLSYRVHFLTHTHFISP